MVTSEPIQRQLIAEHWDDLLRLAASLKFGHATSSLLVAKLQAGSRQNGLTRALLEYGRAVRSVYILGHLVVKAGAVGPSASSTRASPSTPCAAGAADDQATSSSYQL